MIGLIQSAVCGHRVRVAAYYPERQQYSGLLYSGVGIDTFCLRGPQNRRLWYLDRQWVNRFFIFNLIDYILQISKNDYFCTTKQITIGMTRTNILRIEIATLLIIMPIYMLAYTNGSLWPGQSVSVQVNTSAGYSSPVWTTNNPTLQLNPRGFICNIVANAYFSGTATVKCSYKYKVGSTTYSNSTEWNYTCNATDISISPASIQMNIGETYQLSQSFNYSTYMTPTIYYSGYDNKLIDISSNGIITAKKDGTTDIYVTSNLGNNTAKCKVTVINQGVDIGETLKFVYSALDMTASVSGINNYSSDYIVIPKTTWLFDDDYVNGEYTVTGISYNAFKGCKNIKGIEIPSTVNSIGIQAFGDCSSLTTINLPESLTELSKSIFLNCSSLEHLIIPSNIKSIGNQAFCDCSSLQEIILPKMLSDIKTRTFARCNSLKNVDIPESVQYIDWDAFWDCKNLITIRFNGSTTEIRSNSFDGCNNIQNIYCLSSNPPILKDDAFPTNVYNCATLYVPEESIDIYHSDSNWGKFLNIQAYKENAGIVNIENNSSKQEIYYNIFGNRIINPTKGQVYIKIVEGIANKVIY